MSTETRRIAKITSTTLGYEDHGIFTAYVHLDYGGAGQGAGGYFLDGAPASSFIQGILKAAGVSEWERLKGRTVYAIIRDDLVRGLEPLPTEPGSLFDFDAWSDSLPKDN